MTGETFVNMLLPGPAEQDCDWARKTAAQLLAKSVVHSEMLTSGGNNQLYKIVCEDGNAYALKSYFQRSGHPGLGLEVEYRALNFLHAAGLTCVPEPVTGDTEAGVGIYQFIDGSQVIGEEATREDIDAVVEFVQRLQSVSRIDGASALPNAAEACFSFDGMIQALHKRLRVFDSIDAAPDQELLNDFLTQQFRPLMSEVITACESAGAREKFIVNKVLSPSDFGLHNAIKIRLNGKPQLFFLDFEYFGWDLFEKMAADFMLHPGMGLNQALQSYFITRLTAFLPDQDAILQRLHWVYPMSALKWCLIMLNEFIPERMHQRKFAGDQSQNEDERRRTQLGKVNKLLAAITENMCSYPYPETANAGD